MTEDFTERKAQAAQWFRTLRDRIVAAFEALEDLPGEGAAGFYRGVFDATRFQGGGLRPTLVTRVIDAGPFAPVFLSPTAADFVAGIPLVSSRGMGRTTINVFGNTVAALALCKWGSDKSSTFGLDDTSA